MPRTWKFPLKKVLALVVSTSVSLLAAELALRNFKVFDPFPDIGAGERETKLSSHAVEDEAIGWKMPPRDEFIWSTGEGGRIGYRSNGDGFRSDREFDASETRKKIVLAGDSFVFGVGVDYPETFGARLEAKLPGSVVYNLGMPGFGVDQIWQTVRN